MIYCDIIIDVAALIRVVFMTYHMAQNVLVTTKWLQDNYYEALMGVFITHMFIVATLDL